MTTAVRKIIHVDMDAFYASVEQRDDPALRGRPVVVAWKGARSVVCAASYEARRYGVRSAMPALRAERLCWDAVFVPPDFARYKAVSREIREIFHAHTDLVQPLSLDEAYLDVTAPRIDSPSATATAQAIRAQIRERTRLTASAGVAPNKFIAKIASDWNKPDGLFVVKPAQVDAFLLPLPVGRIPGVGKVMQGKLAELGVRTVGELRGLAQEELQLRFRTQERLAQLSAASRIAALSSDGVIPQDRMAVEAALANYQSGRVPFVTVLEAVATLYGDRQAHVRVLAAAQATLAALEEASLEPTSGAADLQAAGAGPSMGGSAAPVAAASMSGMSR